MKLVVVYHDDDIIEGNTELNYLMRDEVQCY